MDLIYRDRAVKDLKDIGPSDRKKAVKKIEFLLLNPLAGKKLEGELSHLRSLRAWPLRILYTFDPSTQTIIIKTIDYRGQVYK